MGIYESSGRSYSDPLSAVAMITGLAGAVLSGALWLVRFEPQTQLLGSYGARLSASGALTDQVAMLAAVLGAIALIFGIVSSMGGRARLTTSLSIVLGVLAISYPVLTGLNVITGPLSSHVP
jgi:hypothetical protein